MPPKKKVVSKYESESDSDAESVCSSDSEDEDMISTEKHTVLSWDVGIKNLAYCIVTRKRDDFEIKDWNRISIAEGGSGPTCQFIGRGGKMCCKPAKVEIKNKGGKSFNENYDTSSVFMCKAHEEKAPLEFTSIKRSAKLECCYGRCSERATNGVVGVDHYAWCDKHHIGSKTTLNKNLIKKKIARKKCTREDMQKLVNNLINILDEIPDLVKVDEVLIENQPAFKNPTMKAIGASLMTYFVLRGVVEKKKNKSTIQNIKMRSASNKLKVGGKTTNTALKNAKVENKVYAMTKKLGVKYCRALISEEDEEILDEHKKVDDMADAFLQAFQYMFPDVPPKYIKILQKVGLENVEKAKPKVAKKVKSKSK